MGAALDHNEIARILPQAYPFVMIDRVIEFKKGGSLTTVKNITANEWMFANPQWQSNVFPETLLLEAAAQGAVAFYRLDKGGNEKSVPGVFLGKIKAEFFHPVHIGDQITLKTLLGKMLATGGYMDVDISSGAEKVAQVQIFYSLR